MGEAPAITLSAPVQMRSGKWKVEIQVSSQPGLKHRRFGDTADDADSLAREFLHAALCQFYRSLAAKHHRAARRIATAREAAGEAATAEEAA